MNRLEFQMLRDLPGKVIEDDIIFVGSKNVSPNLVFSDVPVKNSLGVDLVVNGTFNPKRNSITYNFTDRSVGAICRLDINGQIHKPVGRTHKHSVKSETDIQRHLPDADAVPQYVDKSPGEAWAMLCASAHIEHRGQFNEPELPNANV